MNIRENIRPGGRSARVQASVHAATQALLTEMDRSELTIPMIAQRAGVTPSTIYRRWGELQELLADVAVERLRPDADPLDTGDPRRDLEAWIEQYADEMSSRVGRAMIRDVLASLPDGRNAGKCCAYSRQQVEMIASRAAGRGQSFPDVDAVMDYLVAPVMYRILFSAVPTATDLARLLENVMPRGKRQPGVF